MTSTVARAIRFWAHPAAIIALWVVVSVFSLTQLATVLPSLASGAAVQRSFQDRGYDGAPRGCVDVC